MYMQLPLQSISARPTLTKVKTRNPKITSLNAGWDGVRVDVPELLLGVNI